MKLTSSIIVRHQIFLKSTFVENLVLLFTEEELGVIFFAYNFSAIQSCYKSIIIALLQHCIKMMSQCLRRDLNIQKHSINIVITTPVLLFSVEAKTANFSAHKMHLEHQFLIAGDACCHIMKNFTG